MCKKYPKTHQKRAKKRKGRLKSGQKVEFSRKKFGKNGIDTQGSYKKVYEKDENNKTIRKKLEVDFVVNKGSKRIYIQFAYALPDAEKVQQEKHSLLNIPDSFQKIIIMGDYRRSNFNEEGVLFVVFFYFLLESIVLQNYSRQRENLCIYTD